VLVTQDIDVLPAQSLGDGIGVHAEIVIPQHRVYPVTRSQTPQDLGSRSDISPE
jgi:hypothetical protein